MLVNRAVLLKPQQLRSEKITSIVLSILCALKTVLTQLLRLEVSKINVLSAGGIVSVR